jgi:DNA-binding NarL/FixJ family response regulator
MAKAQPFTLRCQGVEYAMEESGSQGILLIEDSTEDYVVARYILQQVTDHPIVRCMPVVVFTISTQPYDIDLCYQLGTNSYIVKPVDFERLRHALELLTRYWFNAVTLPERRSP